MFKFIKKCIKSNNYFSFFKGESASYNFNPFEI